MTQLFHEGQEVEVVKTVRAGQMHQADGIKGFRKIWCKAKIVEMYVGATYEGEAPKVHSISVQFQDGTRAIFDAMHIRAVSP